MQPQQFWNEIHKICIKETNNIPQFSYKNQKLAYFCSTVLLCRRASESAASLCRVCSAQPTNTCCWSSVRRRQSRAHPKNGMCERKLLRAICALILLYWPVRKALPVVCKEKAQLSFVEYLHTFWTCRRHEWMLVCACACLCACICYAAKRIVCGCLRQMLLKVNRLPKDLQFVVRENM